jgi:hypothetical protein
MPASLRSVSPIKAYSCKHSGLRSVAGFMEDTEAPLMTLSEVSS